MFAATAELLGFKTNINKFVFFFTSIVKSHPNHLQLIVIPNALCHCLTFICVLIFMLAAYERA